MYTSAILAVFASSLMAVQGAIVTLYAGPQCTGETSVVTVDDNSCKSNVLEFQSFIVTSSGTDGQHLSTWSDNGCGGQRYDCEPATVVGSCYNSFGIDYLGSNSISSTAACSKN